MPECGNARAKVKMCVRGALVWISPPETALKHYRSKSYKLLSVDV